MKSSAPGPDFLTCPVRQPIRETDCLQENDCPHPFHFSKVKKVPQILGRYNAAGRQVVETSDEVGRCTMFGREERSPSIRFVAATTAPTYEVSSAGGTLTANRAGAAGTGSFKTP